MPKAPSNAVPSKTGIECEIESEGFSVFLAFRDTRTGETASLKLHRRAANALTALLRATEASDDDAGASAVVLRGELTLTPPKANHENV